MRTIAENANDFVDLRTADGGDYTLGIPGGEVRRDLLLLVAAQAAEA